MSAGDWIQAVSLLFVSLALIVGAYQSRETARQSASLKNALQQSSYEALQQGHGRYSSSALSQDDDLLRWHLEMRGYPVSNAQDNRKTLYLIYKLENHERNVLNNNYGLLSPEVWKAWQAVMRSDLASPEFQSVWPIARQYYAESLVRAIDQMLLESAVASSSPGTGTVPPP